MLAGADETEYGFSELTLVSAWQKGKEEVADWDERGSDPDIPEEALEEYEALDCFKLLGYPVLGMLLSLHSPRLPFF